MAFWFSFYSKTKVIKRTCTTAPYYLINPTPTFKIKVHTLSIPLANNHVFSGTQISFDIHWRIRSFVAIKLISWSVFPDISVLDEYVVVSCSLFSLLFITNVVGPNVFLTLISSIPGSWLVCIFFFFFFYILLLLLAYCIFMLLRDRFPIIWAPPLNWH